MLRRHPGWAQPHLSHRERARSFGVRALQGLCALSPSREGADLPYSAVAKRCSAITHRTLQPSPSQTSSSSGPSAPKGSRTHQPTHSSAAITWRMSQVSSSSREKAACHVPGGEGWGQDPEQGWGGEDIRSGH